MSNSKLKNVCSYAALSGKNAKTVDQLITAAIDSAKTMREKVQVAAIAILIHAEKCGDYTKANDLVNGLGDGVNGAAIVEWFVQFGGLIVDAEEPKNGFTGWNGKEYIKEQFQKAKATAWWELKKQSPWAGFDMAAEVEKLLKRYDNALKKVEAAKEAGEDDKVQELMQKINAPQKVVELLQQANAA